MDKTLQPYLDTYMPLDNWEPKNVNELAVYWMMFYAKVRKAPSSVVRDQYTLKNHILPTFGGSSLHQLTARRVEFWFIKTVKTSTLSTKTCNDSLGLFKKILNDAVRWGFISKNPIEFVRKLTLPQQDVEFWNKDEVQAFLGFWTKRKQPPKMMWAIILALYTGMRRGEILGLKWDAVDFDAGFITVKRIYCRESRRIHERTKSGKIRRIPINKILRAYLLRLKKMTFRSQYVVFRFHPDSFRKIYHRMCQQADVKMIRFHDLRHTFASNFLMSGGNIYDLQKILGHSSVQVTERYTHFIPDFLQGKTDVLEY